MNSKEQLIAEYNQKDSDLKAYWDELSKSEKFKKVLALASLKKGRYSESFPESEVPHIQSERNGGTKGWALLERVLLTTTSSEDSFEEVQDSDQDVEFVGRFN